MILTPEQLAAEMALAVASVDAKTKAAARAASEVGANDARGRAPVVTGALRESIVSDEEGFGATVDYAPFVEFGTYKDPPQPFVFPAGDEAEPVFTAGVLLAGIF